MKENFEPTLRVFSDAAKEKAKEPLLEIKNKLEEEGLDKLAPLAARVKVFELQKEKQAVMDWLHDSLRKIDNKESVQSFTHSMEKPYAVDENMSVICQDGKKVNVTPGMLATDGEWGIEYFLDKEIPRDVKKKFVIEEAEREIMRLLSQQIAVVDVNSKNHTSNVKVGYERILSEKEKEDNEERYGIIAEKAVYTVLKSLEIDNSLPYKVQNSDPFDDYEKKIDIFIETEEKKYGIQYFSGRGEGNIKEETKEKVKTKIRQIKDSKKDFGTKDVDDIILVAFPIYKMMESYRAWIEKGKKPGGPVSRWDFQTKEIIFRGVLKNIFDESWVDKTWNKLKNKTILEQCIDDLSRLEPTEKVIKKIENKKQLLKELEKPVNEEEHNKKLIAQIEESIKSLSKLEPSRERDSKIRKRQQQLVDLKQVMDSDKLRIEMFNRKHSTSSHSKK